MESLRNLDWGTYYFFHFHTQESPGVRALLHVVAGLGSYVVLAVVVLAVTAGLATRRQRRTARFFLAATLLGAGLLTLLSLLLERDRPAEVVAERSGPFQGNALASSAVYLTLALVAAPALVRSPRRRLLLQTGCFVLVFAIDLSRLILGLHFLTEALAGWVGGLAWAIGCRGVADGERAVE